MEENYNFYWCVKVTASFKYENYIIHIYIRKNDIPVFLEAQPVVSTDMYFSRLMLYLLLLEVH